VVPLLSVLTLAVTIITQTLQQRDQERSRQDTIWRGTIEEFKSATQRNVAFGGLLAQVKLKPFFKSTEYGEQANQLARLVLPRVTDRDAFRDLFDSVEWHDLNEMAAVNRTMNTVYDELNARSAKLTAAESNPEPAPSEHGTKTVRRHVDCKPFCCQAPRHQSRKPCFRLRLAEFASFLPCIV